MISWYLKKIKFSDLALVIASSAFRQVLINDGFKVIPEEVSNIYNDLITIRYTLYFKLFCLEEFYSLKYLYIREIEEYLVKIKKKKSSCNVNNERSSTIPVSDKDRFSCICLTIAEWKWSQAPNRTNKASSWFAEDHDHEWRSTHHGAAYRRRSSDQSGDRRFQFLLRLGENGIVGELPEEEGRFLLLRLQRRLDHVQLREEGHRYLWFEFTRLKYITVNDQRIIIHFVC